MWWQFAVDGDASRIMWASVVVALILVGIMLNLLLNRSVIVTQKKAIPDAVRQLIAQSDNTASQLDLLGDEAFLAAQDNSAYLGNFDHAVLRHVETGRIVAFANLFQGAHKHELSLDLMRYDPAGPKLAMDALFRAMMLWGAPQGFQWFSLGAAPFSGIENRQLPSL